MEMLGIEIKHFKACLQDWGLTLTVSGRTSQDHIVLVTHPSHFLSAQQSYATTSPSWLELFNPHATNIEIWLSH